MTAEASLDVVGIGNALVDVISHESDDFLVTHRLVKSSMTLIDTERAEELYAAMGPGIEMSGGSAANTIAGVASFGGTAAYMGRIFDDQLGTVASMDLNPGKSRVLLQLALTKSSDAKKVQDYFDRY